MNKIEFHRLADSEMNYLMSVIEEQDKDCILDVDILNEILTITLPSNKQYVINKQNYTQQIWLSSPFTGAHHFDYNATIDLWVARKNQELRYLLNNEIANIAALKF